MCVWGGGGRGVGGVCVRCVCVYGMGVCVECVCVFVRERARARASERARERVQLKRTSIIISTVPIPCKTGSRARVSTKKHTNNISNKNR